MTEIKKLYRIVKPALARLRLGVPLCPSKWEAKLFLTL